ncbi:MAG: HIT family protein [Nitrososphaeria archaeon]
MERCVFCRIVQREEESFLVYEDEGRMAFTDRHPVNIGHTLVIPKKHYSVLEDMLNREVGALFEFAARIARAAIRAVDAKGFNLLQSNGEAAWQEIPHVHVHIIPRFPGDYVRLSWPVRKVSALRLDETARVMRSYLAAEG